MLYQLLSALLVFLCHNIKVRMLLDLFWRKSEIFQNFLTLFIHPNRQDRYDEY